MPDAFTPFVALSLIAIARPLPASRHLPLPLAGSSRGADQGRGEGGSCHNQAPIHRLALTAIAAIAIAAHLSHLILAAALIGALALLHRRIPWRPLASLAAALLFLLASNWIGHGRPAISPYGSVFALARLIADGPARDYLGRTCPQAGWALCPWRDQLTDDSDQFLWDAKSPFWADPTPLPDFAAQAGQIVLGTIRAEPLRVVRDAYRNAAHQLIRADLGDTLVPDYLADTVRPRLQRFYPPAELARFDAARQARGALAPLGLALLPLHHAVLLIALAAAAAILLAGLRRPNPRADLTALLLIALAANALSTGALSAVHDRYQARLAWILLLPLLPQTFSRWWERARVRVEAPRPKLDGGAGLNPSREPAPNSPPPAPP